MMILAFVAGFLSSFAQVEWLETDYDFGAFPEAGGPVTGRARFVNKGDKATFVSRVRPSCGCTGATYPHTMIEPGDTAEITFTYNPKGRPGRFEKTVKVYIGEEPVLTTIKIKGTVIGEPTTLEANFPTVAGPMRTEKPVADAGMMRRGMARHLFLNAYNQSADTIQPVWGELPPELEVSVKPEKILPGDIATFAFYLRSEKIDKDGLVEYVVNIKPDKSSPDEDVIPVKVKAVITREDPPFKIEN